MRDAVVDFAAFLVDISDVLDFPANYIQSGQGKVIDAHVTAGWHFFSVVSWFASFGKNWRIESLLKSSILSF